MKEIKLTLTTAQFEAFFALAEEMVITVGMIDDETARITNRRVRLVNKAFRQNGLKYKIRS